MPPTHTPETRSVVLAALLGLLNHLYFHRFTPKSAGGPILVLIAQPVLLLFAISAPISLARILITYVTFLSTLSASIVVYRLSPWHPLAHIPGPVLYKITKLWSTRIVASGQSHRVTKALHEDYGGFVRTGPNEISVIEVDAVKAVFGTGGFPKGEYYDSRKDPRLTSRNLLILRGEAHSHRRRIWNRGMSTESIDEYESAILAKRVNQFMDKLEGLQGTPFDISAWFGYFTFDVMGDMAFGGGFEMLRDGGDKEGLWALIKSGGKSLAIVSQIPWIAPLLHKIPGATQGIKRLRGFGAACAMERIKAGAKVKDLWYHLTDEVGLEKSKPQISDVAADGVLSIVAGSDTTSTVLAAFIWLLLSHPDVYRRVQAEIDSVYSDVESTLDSSKHADLKLLTACLNESLRLQPSVCTGGPRQVPEGQGKMVAGQFVPEHTQIYIPPYSLHRNPEYFSDPEKFDPDRWLRPESSEFTHNSAAFIPFSYGAANCVGKALAVREMTMVASALVRRFEMRFAEGFEEQCWGDMLCDYFITSIEVPLMVEISRRR
ncbi:high nitrogen upregulated cytochrome P450 monooxygenase 2 [Roridomyces roridus]|uniref:High nitrogen upregulated cytochrome P450 monooxygenase 2 n=1 Tax=Roridomyces roridus TaxID=1738132 RepID=A0AAD7BXM1_9AGAR|nr:high nitrogen upregulated cytochrome P450 monooxygenase 2 [Roridomyces roridus]